MKKILTKKVLFALFISIAFLGFIDAGYLTIKHYQNEVVPCSVTGGCEDVLKSSFATIAGVPLALFGAAYYGILLILFSLYIKYRYDDLLILTLIITTLGFLISLGLLYIQIFIIGSICIFCIGSFITSTLLFILNILFVVSPQLKQAKQTDSQAVQ